MPKFPTYIDPFEIIFNSIGYSKKKKKKKSTKY